MALDQRGDRLRIGPGHPGRPDQGGVGLAHEAQGRIDPLADLADRSAGDGRRLDERRLGPEQGRGHGRIGIEADDDDRDRAAGPGRLGNPPNGGQAVGVGQGGFGPGGEDDGSDGHRRIVANGPIPAGSIRTGVRQWLLP